MLRPSVKILLRGCSRLSWHSPSPVHRAAIQELVEPTGLEPAPQSLTGQYAPIDTTIPSTEYTEVTEGYLAPFFFGFGLLNGSGSALFGTDRIVLAALRNLFMASGPSFISVFRGAIDTSLPHVVAGEKHGI